MPFSKSFETGADLSSYLSSFYAISIATFSSWRLPTANIFISLSKIWKYDLKPFTINWFVCISYCTLLKVTWGLQWTSNEPLTTAVTFFGYVTWLWCLNCKYRNFFQQSIDWQFFTFSSFIKIDSRFLSTNSII